MVNKVPFFTFATTLYFVPGPSRKLTVAHATRVLDKVLGVSTTGGGEGGEGPLSGSTDFLGGGEACLATGAGWDRFSDFSNSS
jgi:hypothetical protein